MIDKRISKWMRVKKIRR